MHILAVGRIKLYICKGLISHKVPLEYLDILDASILLNRLPGWLYAVKRSKDGAAGSARSLLTIARSPAAAVSAAPMLRPLEAPTVRTRTDDSARRAPRNRPTHRPTGQSFWWWVCSIAVRQLTTDQLADRVVEVVSTSEGGATTKVSVVVE